MMASFMHVVLYQLCPTHGPVEDFVRPN